MYTDPVYLLNDLLHELGEEQDAEHDWAYDVVESGEWFTANHPDGRLVEAFVEHASADACGYTALALSR